MMREIVNIGFLPLTDAAALIAASDFGFAREEGVKICLHRDVSWANLRDKLMVGHYDAAQMLAPLAVAATLGIGQVRFALRAPFLLNLNGNGITVSSDLFSEMRACGADPLADWRAAAQAVAAVVASRRARGAAPLTFATVHLFSTHTYLLRKFLQAGGLDPDHDVEFVVTPPPSMVDFMTRGLVDGFCVGSPWNSFAVDRGHGVLVALGCEIDAAAPEKVLAMPEAGWLVASDTALALLRALASASAMAADPANHTELALRMARPDRLDCPPDLIRRTLAGQLVLQRDGPQRERPDFLLFSGKNTQGVDLHQPEACIDWLAREMAAAGQFRDLATARPVMQAMFAPDLLLKAGR
jgi:NitT/TauT family transport system ATP-binding protein